MRKSRSIPRIVVLLLDVVGIALLVYLVWRFVGPRIRTEQPPSVTEVSQETFSAHVTEVVEEGVVEVNGQAQPYQLLRVQVNEGAWVGQTFEVDYGKSQLAAPGVSVQVGDPVLISVIPKSDGTNQAYFVDLVRTPAMLWLLGTFVVASILLSSWKGIRSMLAMLFSFAVIV
ncbi:MAG TPA: hypothetical protein PKE45_01330 [Caldilineaceae bacterium]|nr:hypothetical protein [Caldilineaceae bacterium]